MTTKLRKHGIPQVNTKLKLNKWRAFKAAEKLVVKTKFRYTNKQVREEEQIREALDGCRNT